MYHHYVIKDDLKGNFSKRVISKIVQIIVKTSRN